jgi:hypothetical protein
MRKRIFLVLASALLVAAGYICGTGNLRVVHANVQDHSADTYKPVQGSVPKAYGRLVTAIPDQIGTGLIFEDDEGVIRFVSMTGMKEGELARYDQTPTRGGIPKAYGHLVAAVVNPKGTGLVFEDNQGVIRFVTIDGKKEGELLRN